MLFTKLFSKGNAKKVDEMTLHGGALAQKGIRTWIWNLTGSDLHRRVFTMNFILGLPYYKRTKEKTIK